MDKITFDGKEYPIRLVQLTDFGVQMVSVESLEDVLTDDNNDFVSEEAMHVDAQIFFYVPDEIIDDGKKTILYMTRHLS